MAAKRTAQEAFGKSKGQLSAFAAARQAKQSIHPATSDSVTEVQEVQTTGILDSIFNGQNEETVIPGLVSSTTEISGVSLPKATAVPLSTFLPDQANVKRDDETALELVLQAEDTLTIVGEYDVQALVGMATVCGTVLHPDLDPHRVFAPSIQALPSVVGRKANTVVRITSINSGLQELNRLSPTFRNIWASDGTKGRSFAPLYSSADDPLQRSFSLLDVDDESKKTLSRLNAKYEDGRERPIIMAIGSKSAGKSTFNRLLCNMILGRWPSESCLYLDLDPGQPEFAPPGQISLVEVKSPILGPSFSHIAGTAMQAYRLVHSHTLAALSFKDDPQHYLACALDLLRRASSSRDIHSLPVVVNSCGWVSGLGANIILQLAQGMHITDVVQLGSTEDGLIESLNALGCAVHPIPRRLTRPSTRAPAELRAMQTMSYFHHLPRKSTTTTAWSSKPLRSIRPWKVSYGPHSPGIHAILSYGQHPAPDFLAEVLDGALVALVAITPGLLDSASLARTPTHNLPYLPPHAHGVSAPLDPRHSECVALALVRGIDVAAQALLLVSPLPRARLTAVLEARQLVLVRGAFDSPDWAYLEDLYAGSGEGGLGRLRGEEVPRPWVTRRDRVGVEGAVWRLRHPPTALAVHRG